MTEHDARFDATADLLVADPPATTDRLQKRLGLRGCEKVVLAYFCYLACLGRARELSTGRLLLLLSAPFMIWTVCKALSKSSRRWVEVVRDWWPLALILPGYWTMAWFPSPYRFALQDALLRMDRTILYRGHLKSMIEVAGPCFPGVLETSYLLLYAIPPLCLCLVYAYGERAQASRLLLLIFAGTFTVYALLPYLSVASPRVAFPNQDLPAYDGVARRINLWLLDHGDISTSVLPSGHVAVAVSSALGVIRVLPQQRFIGRCLLAMAGLVFLATVYGRYHYALDGLFSITLVSLVFCLAGRRGEA